MSDTIAVCPDVRAQVEAHGKLTDSQSSGKWSISTRTATAGLIHHPPLPAADMDTDEGRV